MSNPSRRQWLEVEDNGDVTVVHFMDRKILADKQIQHIGEDLFSLADRAGHTKILLNFSGVEYISMLLLSKLIVIQKELKEKGGKLVMCSIHEDIWEVFEITRLNRLFNCQKDEQSALAAF